MTKKVHENFIKSSNLFFYISRTGSYQLIPYKRRYSFNKTN